MSTYKKKCTCTPTCEDSCLCFCHRHPETKLNAYIRYVNELDEEYLTYEFADRGLEDCLYTPTREHMIERLTAWCDMGMMDDLDWMPTMEYNK